MTGALHRIVPLLDVPEEELSVRDGYFDLLAGQPVRSTRRAQSMWLNDIGAGLYDMVHPVTRLIAPESRRVPERLALEWGSTVLDLGCGPANITVSLAHAVGERGLVVGLDVSEKMLARAVRRTAEPNVGYVRADAERLPLRDESVDALCSSVVLQLVENVDAVVDHIARVVRPGGRVALSATAAGYGLARRLTPHVGSFAGAHMFEPDELPSRLADRGFTGIRSRTHGMLQFVDARKRPA
ncbi:methyltransferase domain-containing protein [Fodinicola acaciae]|uniref:methyltransferase domain-containing protein n=1 Tax=Fodinicola acaciae TaxID=2681555 RepID=UPI0013D87F7B|nr:methyltransferase domain-containing protein [Fodinicola acaciae]